MKTQTIYALGIRRHIGIQPYKKVVFALTCLLLCINLFSQTVPYTLANKSEFPDNAIYVAVVGIQGGTNHVWIDCRTGSVLPMSSSYNTVQGPTPGGDQGPGGNGKYANCFARLSDIPNKTIQIPKIAGCRIFISMNSQLYLYFFGASGAPSGYAGVNLANPNDPNQGIRFEMIELTYADNGMWANTTRVDHYQYPMGLEVWGNNNFYKKVGEIKTHTQIISQWQNYAPSSFAACLDQAKSIILFPTKISSFSRSYFNSYIDAIWSKYTSEDLVFSSGDAGIWRGRVQGSAFVFNRTSDGQVATISRKPTTEEAMEGSGALASGGQWDLVVQAQMCAAITRHAVDLNAQAGSTQNWGDESKYYQTDPYNWYAKFWHQSDISYQGLTYAFCYDDVFDKSSTINCPSPTSAIISIGGFAGEIIDNPPVANAGSDITISLPNNSVTLAGSATDPENDPVSYSWSKISGGEAIILSSNAATTVVNGLVQGSYTFRLTATANNKSVTDDVVVTVNPIGETNLALNRPVFVSSSESAAYQGTNAVDGNASTRWSSAFSNPQWIYVDLGNVYTINRVRLLWEAAMGKDYKLQVTNTPSIESSWVDMKSITGNTTRDNNYTGLNGTGRYARVYISVRATEWGASLFEFEVYGTLGGNIAPIANAGADQTLTAGTTSATLIGTASSDPDNGPSALSYSWLQTSGLSTNISNSNVASPVVTGLVNGQTYKYQLVVNDGKDNSVADEVVVTVNNSGPSNLLINGDFSSGLNSWNSYIDQAANASVSVSNGAVVVAINNGGSQLWNVQLYQGNIKIENNKIYILSFDAKAEANRTITAIVEKNGSPYTTYGGSNSNINITTQMMSYSYEFAMSQPTDANSRVTFNLGTSVSDVVIDNVKLVEKTGTVNIKPIANAGANQNLSAGTTTTSLNGTASSDPDNGPTAIIYSWTQISGSTVSISNNSVASPVITGLTNGSSYTFQLIVNDGADNSTPATVTVDVGSVTYTITTSKTGTGAGSVTANPSTGPYNAGSQVALTAVAATGSTFVKWSGDVSGTSSQVVLTMNSNKSVTAEFALNGNSILIEAENYSDMSGVQIEPCSEGGQNVGYIDAGDWMVYNNVNIPAGTYTVEYRVASYNGGGKIQIEQGGGSPVFGSIDISKTGNWQGWTSVTHDITLGQNVPNLGIAALAGGFNINWIKLTSKNGSNPCSISNTSGDYSVAVSSDANNPTITFIPSRTGVGSPNCILYYSTSNSGPFPGYTVSPNVAYRISASSGQTVYFYYTYTVPEGGEKNTMNNKNSLVVGSCSTLKSSMVENGIESDDIGELFIYPVPMKNVLHLQTTSNKYTKATIVDISGKIVLSTRIIKGANDYTLNVEHLSKGIYLLKLEGETGVETKKLIK